MSVRGASMFVTLGDIIKRDYRRKNWYYASILVAVFVETGADPRVEEINSIGGNYKLNVGWVNVTAIAEDRSFMKKIEGEAESNPEESGPLGTMIIEMAVMFTELV